MAESCVPLSGSTSCPAFNTSSISTTDSFLVGKYPFLANVTDAQSFDIQLRHYVATAYVQLKYQTLFGCNNVNLANTDSLYARYTQSFVCNAIIQNSITACSLAPENSRPLCADSCGEFALSEQQIVSSPQLCGTSIDPISQLRADFTNCALPVDALTGSCVAGVENEGRNCGFESNIDGLCAFCRGSTQNSTDSCCVTSNSESRCQGVTLPVFSSVEPLFPMSTAAPEPSSPSSPTSSPSVGGLSGAQIAGVVVGSVLGAALLVALVVLCCVYARRKKMQVERSSLNQPTPPRSGESTGQPAQPRFEVLPGARVTRMTALEGTSEQSSHDQTPRQIHEKSSSSEFDASPEGTGGIMSNFPKRRERGGEYDSSSPEHSSPEAQGQSEQMSSFKDYYSDDEIRPGDMVSVLWAYQPRANDEFELERGDMLRIVGIWDDGWSTGVRINMRAEDWEPGRNVLRDSGVSSASRQEDSPPSNGEIKAFPLVCVCLPQHWRKTIEGESSSSDDRHAPE